MISTSTGKRLQGELGGDLAHLFAMVTDAGLVRCRCTRRLQPVKVGADVRRRAQPHERADREAAPSRSRRSRSPSARRSPTRCRRRSRLTMRADLLDGERRVDRPVAVHRDGADDRSPCTRRRCRTSPRTSRGGRSRSPTSSDRRCPPAPSRSHSRHPVPARDEAVRRRAPRRLAVALERDRDQGVLVRSHPRVGHAPFTRGDHRRLRRCSAPGVHRVVAASAADGEESRKGLQTGRACYACDGVPPWRVGGARR